MLGCRKKLKYYSRDSIQCNQKLQLAQVFIGRFLRGTSFLPVIPYFLLEIWLRLWSSSTVQMWRDWSTISPSKTLATLFEIIGKGRKKAKEHMTINACANLTSSIKLPFLLIGKSAHLWCFRGIKHGWPSSYLQSQNNAWVNTTVFMSWFHYLSVPIKQTKLQG